MQLISDAVAVLGSRHGLLFNPHARETKLIRFDRFDESPAFSFRAGLRVDGRELIFPLSNDGELFRLLDQRISPCASTLIGLDPTSGLKIRLSFVTPFRPRDADFSTTPALGIELAVEPIGGQFRWEKVPTRLPAEVDVFLEIRGDVFEIAHIDERCLELNFSTEVRPSYDPSNSAPNPSRVFQRDRLVALSGSLVGTTFLKKIVPQNDAVNEALRVVWCTWSDPILRVKEVLTPFRYTRRFKRLEDVETWAKKEGGSIFENASKVDGIVAKATVGISVHHLLAQTLHSWLACSWWTLRSTSEWFSIWEGNCYFHSTVDVEFTQAPFYLAVWPELLGLELDQWPEFSKSGEELLGDAGKDTSFLSHDCGSYTEATGQAYPHEMEVEETANYVLMAFSYSRRTGDGSLLNRHADTLGRYLRFLLACDTSGNGVPDIGVANTIDDGSPAIQYGKQQTYLAVKVLAALQTGGELLRSLNRSDLATRCENQASRLRTTIERDGWMADHFAVLLEKSGTLQDPWSGKKIHWETIPGWDAPHIYTANTLPILDMVGFDLGLDKDKLRQDLVTSTARCLREYGCVHTDFDRGALAALSQHSGLAGASRNPGWISMNITRDLAAFYRGIDLRNLTERYWEWQLVTNSREAALFFETFDGNDLHFYPRGVAIWGIFDALGGIVISRWENFFRAEPKIGELSVPLLFSANWKTGAVEVIRSSRS